MAYRFVISVVALLIAWPALPQDQSLAFEQLNEQSLIMEQSAICSAYARVMEYSGLLDKKQGELWQERRFFAGAILRKNMAVTTGEAPTDERIDEIIRQYSGWIIGLFTANTTNLPSDDTQERDKLESYITNFCASLFDSADKAISRVRPDLFADAIQQKSGKRIDELEDENRKLKDMVASLEQMLIEEARSKELAAIPDQPAPAKEGAEKAEAAEENSDITANAPGLTQIQLAAYSDAEKAQRGQMVLINKMPDDYGDVELEIMKVTLASGRDVYRVISEPIRLDAARSICTHFWSIQYGCIIKLHN